MPSTSKKQHNFMEAVAHNKAFAKKAGVPQSVGKEFAAADKGKTFKSGGAARQNVNQPKTNHGSQALFKQGGQTMATAKMVKPTAMGKVKTAAPSRDGVAVKGKTRGKNLGDSGKTVGIQSGAKRGKK